jgi:hypothetical protein
MLSPAVLDWTLENWPLCGGSALVASFDDLLQRHGRPLAIKSDRVPAVELRVGGGGDNQQTRLGQRGRRGVVSRFKRGDCCIGFGL